MEAEKISKNNCIFHFIGTADELNSWMGLIKAELKVQHAEENTRQFIERIQKNLQIIMAHVSDPANNQYLLNENEITVLEKETASLAAKIPGQTGFVLPGHNTTEAQIHITRTVARRTERMFAAANDSGLLCTNAGVYLNRLSDYLFILAKFA